MESVRVNGFRLGYLRAGEGPPLVLLAGGGDDHKWWRRQVQDLSADFTVVAWDAPGTGTSDDPPEQWRLPEYADCLAGLIEELGLDRPCVLGLSFGSGLALELYARRPELAGSLVLVSAYAGWAGSLPPEEVAERLRLILREADRLPDERDPMEYLPGLLGDTAPADLVHEVQSLMAETRPAGMLAMARSFAEADLRHVLPRITVPTLFVHGELDARSPLPMVRWMHSQVPGSELVVIPGVGHLVNMEAPRLFNDVVRQFLTRAARPAAGPGGGPA